MQIFSQQTILAFILFFFCNDLLAEKPPLFFNYLDYKTGLASNEVKSIVQDQNGFLWFGTARGLSRYSGTEIKNFYSSTDSSSLQSNNINKLYCDSQNRLWIGHLHKGISQYIPETESFKNFNIENTGLQSMSCTDIIEDINNDIWFSSYYGLSFFDNANETFTTYLTGKQYKRVLEYNDKLLWLVTEFDGIHVFNKHEKEIVGHYKSELFDNQRMQDIYRDKSGRIWVLSKNGGLYHFDEKIKDFKSIPILLEGKKQKYNVTEIIQDHQNNYYIGTESSGLILYKPEIQKFHQYLSNISSTHHIKDNGIKNLLIDHEGNLWVTTFKTGAGYSTILTNKFWQYVHKLNDTTTIPHNDIESLTLLKSDNAIVVSGGGLYLLNKHTGKISSVGLPKTENNFTAITTDNQNRLWASSWHDSLSLFQLEDDKLMKIPLPVPLQNLDISNSNAIFHDSKNRIWISSHKIGLVIYDIDKNEVATENNNGKYSKELFKQKFIRSFFEDSKGRIWISTSYGLYLLDEYENAHDFFAKPREKTEMPTSDIYFVTETANGNILISSVGGLCLFNENTFNIILLHLPFQPLAAQPLPNGKIVFATDKGIVIYENLNDTYEIFDNNYEMHGNSFTPAISALSSNNHVYFCGINGIIKFKPDSLNHNTIEPQPKITSFKTDDTQINDLTSLSHINVNAGTRNITFNFSSFSFAEPQKCNYKYKLEGFEDKWQYTSTPNANYTNLPGGTYRFVVNASNNNNLWSKHPYSITIIIDDFWYESTLLWVVVIISVLSLLFFIFKYRVGKAIRNQHKLEATVARRTHSLQKAKDELLSQNEEYRTQQEILYNQRTEIEIISDQLKEQFSKLKQADVIKEKIIKAISSEIKSPVNSIIGFVDILSESYTQINESKRIELLSYLKASANMLNSNIDKLLKTAHEEQHNIRFIPEEIDLKQLLQEALNALHNARTYKKVSFENNINFNIAIYADKWMTETSIQATLNTIIRHASINSKVVITPSFDENKCVIDIDFSHELFNEETLSDNNELTNIEDINNNFIIPADFIKLNNGDFKFAKGLKKSSVTIKLPLKKQ